MFVPPDDSKYRDDKYDFATSLSVINSDVNLSLSLANFTIPISLLSGSLSIKFCATLNLLLLGSLNVILPESSIISTTSTPENPLVFHTSCHSKEF